jgi:hypothetical protein
VHEVAAEVVQRSQTNVTVGTGDPPNVADAINVEFISKSPVGVAIRSAVGAIKLSGVIAVVAVEVSELPIAFDAETLNVYFKPLVKVPSNLHASGVGKGTTKVHVNAGLNAIPFSSKASMSYFVIGDPPVFGAVKFTVADLFEGEATIFVGVEGLPTGVTAVEGKEGGELPTPFLATTVKVYGVPLVRPEISQPFAGFVVRHVSPPGEEVTMYSTIDDPPLSVGAVKVTIAFPGAGDVALTAVGAAEIVAGVTAMVAVEESDVNTPLFAWTTNVIAVPLTKLFTVQPRGSGKFGVGVITQVWPVDAVTV